MKPHRILNLFRMPFNFVHARFYPISYARKIGVTLGKDCVIYGSSYKMFGSEPYLVTIGDNVHITHASFIAHDGAVLPLRKAHPTLDITAPIVIGSNCFVGYGAIILAGVTIGDDCIIGAGAVVAKDIATNSVAVGNPARVVRPTDEYLAKALTRSTHLGAYEGLQKKRKYKQYFGIE